MKLKSYSELLESPEWVLLRQKIKNRDNNKCTKCETCPSSFVPNIGHVTEINRITEEEIHIIDDDGIPFEGKINLEQSAIYSNNSPTFLHVHHKYYVIDKMPWEYPEDALITLCNWCHFEYHRTHAVPVYKSFEAREDLHYHQCNRCNGAGFFPEYSHVNNGVCFECSGYKYYELMPRELQPLIFYPQKKSK